ncbi:OTU domain [Sesbania bispinosa]|nr:OTU domain [Sesbania bispinosa]
MYLPQTRDHDFVVVIMRSDSGGIDRKIKLRGRPLAKGVGWKLNVVCGVYNHEVAENLEGHPYAGRLTVEEKSLLEDMTKNMVKPRSILLTLKDHDVHNVTTIKQNMKAKWKQLVTPATLQQPVMDAWISVIQSPTKIDFDDRFAQFEELCPPTLFDYVNKTWIFPHKEIFVAAWIDRVMHLGNTTTNKVESVHARLKRLLQDSRGDICNCWDAMNNLIILQHTEIKASFQRSIMNLEHLFNNRLYKLFGFVSKNAMVHIFEEMRRVEYIGIDTSTCGCKLRMTYGLPCACQLAICKMYFGFIPVEKVHAHWRRLTFTDQVSEAECAGVTLRPELDELKRRFDELNMDGKVAFKYKVREFAFPNTTSMCPPPENVRTKGSTKGQSQTESSTKRDPLFFEYVDAMRSPHDSNSTRPSSSILRTKTHKRKKVVPMLDQFPTVMHDYIESVVDVARDGNCGYRAISALLGIGEESWPIIR